MNTYLWFRHDGLVIGIGGEVSQQFIIPWNELTHLDCFKGKDFEYLRDTQNCTHFHCDDNLTWELGSKPEYEH